MELTYKDLTKREVINLPDGRSLGFIKNIKICFPSGVMVGIFVPGKRLKCYQKIFNRSSLYIDQKDIIKIGGDVILVDVSPVKKKENYVNLGGKNTKPCPPPCPPNPSPCPPPCPKPCPPPCSKPCPPTCDNNSQNDNPCDNVPPFFRDVSSIIIDTSDY